MAKINLSEELIQKIIEAYLTPMMLMDVAKKFNLTRKVVTRVLREHNVPHHSQAIICELRKKTYLEHYGVEHPMFSNEVKEHLKQTNLDKYGVENVFQNKDIYAKMQQTWLNNYGQVNPQKSEVIRQKTINTCLDKYGVETPFLDENAREIAKQTYLKHFGVSNPMQAAEIREKAASTCLDKYGVEHYTQTLEYHKNSRKHYVYDDTAFDSLPELCFYLYHIKNEINIVRAPVKLTYYVNNEAHYYVPDFLVDGQLIEIKGAQFLDEDGSWKNPYNEQFTPAAKAKYECAINNNVKILYINDYQQYIDWFENAGYNKDDFKC